MSTGIISTLLIFILYLLSGMALEETEATISTQITADNGFDKSGCSFLTGAVIERHLRSIPAPPVTHSRSDRVPACGWSDSIGRLSQCWLQASLICEHLLPLSSAFICDENFVIVFPAFQLPDRVSSPSTDTHRNRRRSACTS